MKSIPWDTALRAKGVEKLFKEVFHTVPKKPQEPESGQGRQETRMAEQGPAGNTKGKEANKEMKFSCVGMG